MAAPEAWKVTEQTYSMVVGINMKVILARVATAGVLAPEAMTGEKQFIKLEANSLAVKAALNVIPNIM